MMQRKIKLLDILFILYIIFMLWLLFGQRMGYLVLEDYVERLKENVNLIPFKTAGVYFKQLFISDEGISRSHAVINLFGNVIMFVPLGLLIPYYSPKKLSLTKFVLYVLIIIATIEIIQLFTMLGSFDIDDLTLNTLGAVIGYPFRKLLK